MATKESKRVAFKFDAHSLATLEEMKEDGHYSSLAETVRDSLQINRALQTQAKKGYNEIIVRDSETGDERVLVIPSLQSLSRRGE
jgi:Arc/MetJ-type ribon-helix-helix transcriptional regulator